MENMGPKINWRKYIEQLNNIIDVLGRLIVIGVLGLFGIMLLTPVLYIAFLILTGV